MVELTCPHCQNSGFEAGWESIAGISGKICVLRCAACGAPVSVLQSAETSGAVIDDISQMVSRLHRHVEKLEDRLNAVLDRQTGS